MAEDRANERVQEILETEYRVFTMNNDYMKRVNETKDDKNRKEKEQGSQAIPPPIMTIDNPFANQICSSPTKSPTTGINTIAHLKAETLTSTLLTASKIVSAVCTLTTNEALAAQDIQTALNSYCLIVQQRLTDSISQTCYHHFITKCALVIDQALTMACPSSDLIRYMKEPADQTKQRENLTRTIKAYEDALRIGQDYL